MEVLHALALIRRANATSRQLGQACVTSRFLVGDSTRSFFAAMAQQLLAAEMAKVSAISRRLSVETACTCKFLLANATLLFFAEMA